MKQKLRQCALPLLAVLLISIFPVLFLYFANAGEVDFIDAVQPLAVFCALGLAIFFITLLVSRSCVKAAIISGVFMLLFSNFALLEKGMKLLLPELRYWHTVPIILVLFLHLAFLVWKFVPEQLGRDITGVLCLVFGGLLVLNCVLGVPKIMSKQQAQRQLLQEKAARQEAVASATADSPNVYLLIFDEYAGFKQIKEYYGYDNAVLQDYLKKNNFTISYNSRNESILTTTILTNLLNLDYVVDDANDIKEKETRRKQGKLFSLMREHGYTVRVVEDGDFMGQESPTRNQNAASSMTATGEDLAYLCYQKTLIYSFYRLNTSEALDNVLKLSDYLSAEENIPTSPTFTLGYLIFPHAPFITDENGNAIPSNQYMNWNDNRYYLGQYKYATNLMMQIIDNILENDPDSIILLQSDHGARGSPDLLVTSEKFTVEAMTNPLNAIYYRGEDAQEIRDLSSVNTMRTVCVRLWDEPFEHVALPEGNYQRVLGMGD